MKLTSPESITALYKAVQNPGTEMLIGERDGLSFHIIRRGNGPLLVVKEDGNVISTRPITITAPDMLAHAPGRAMARHWREI